jgi:hypothetical protein
MSRFERGGEQTEHATPLGLERATCRRRVLDSNVASMDGNSLASSSIGINGSPRRGTHGPRHIASEVLTSQRQQTVDEP